MEKVADKVLVSTCIYDSVSKEPFAGYVAIKGNYIAEVGKGNIPAYYQSEEIPVVDCGSGTICAGFGDTHSFFTGFIIDELGVNLSDVSDVSELSIILKNAIKDNMNNTAKNPESKKVLFGNHFRNELVKADETMRLLEDLGNEFDLPIVLFVPGHGTCAMNQRARDKFGFSPEVCHSEALYKIMGIYLNDRSFVDKQLEAYIVNFQSFCD